MATSRDNLHATNLTLEPVDVSDSVRNAATLVGSPKEIALDLQSNVVVEADRDRLAQILINLLSNADRYGGERIVVVSRIMNEHVEIAVHDDGAGVPQHHLESIWAAFERGIHRFDESVSGSGLGLAIVRSLVRAHHGQVGYRTSELLGGACFWIKLPRLTRPVQQRDASRVDSLSI